jgi:S1-C subfamily serine protease
MRLSPSRSALAAALLALAVPAALPAQAAASTPAASRPAGCRGVTSGSSSIVLARPDGSSWEFPTYSTIESVQPGSPAERAGFKPGDVVVLQDGQDMVGHPAEHPPLAGDTVVFTVRRGDAEVPLKVVMGRWDPPEEAPGVDRICRPLGEPAHG